MSGVLPPLLFPLVVTAMVAYSLAVPSFDLASALGLAVPANPALQVLSAIVIFYALLAGLERVFPYRSAWNRSHGDVLADSLHLLLTGTTAQALVRAVVLAPLAALSAWIAGQAGGVLWPTGWPMLAQLALAIALGELGHYVFHRLSHESPWVWRLHAAHHAAERLYWLNATRFHVLDLFFLISFESLPLAAMGATAEVLAPYFVFRAVYGQLQHCNVAMPTPRWLDWLWSSPNVHRWHHSTDSREGNHNYGAVLNVWDHVFRSFFRPARAFAGPVGIGQLPVFPRSYVGQQLSPFRWAAIRRAQPDPARISPRRAAARCAPRAADGSGTGASNP